MKTKIALCLTSLILGFSYPVTAQTFNPCLTNSNASVAQCQNANLSETVAILEDGRSYEYETGQGIYRVRYNYTGKNWTHADVAPIRINTNKPIAILPMQYTSNGLQSGASVNGVSVGRVWNSITVEEMKRRLEKLGFYVLTPTISMYGESIDGFQALEHFIAGVHKGNSSVQTVVLSADANIPNAANPRPGAQMLVTGLHHRDLWWEYRIQNRLTPFYQQQHLVNIGPRVRGGQNNREGHSLAWHPMIERAAEYNPKIAIIEVAQAAEIIQRAGSIQAGRQWAAPVFDAVALGMAEQACATGGQGETSVNRPDACSTGQPF
ncbi:conserved exported hypothetical protein [Planktothrix serta PCC 8927]|uniref:Uncharacterized protein n=1 Tax=Planktothrix serta PCC 8927 TaxID=671068 RepID=A0A7Z9BSC9_9CYAN|nr:hypothetical protein [Planktothrix serta]VXD20100.1 conserved exported hypothetical protein [Planktothrix serta PCC 8927]